MSCPMIEDIQKTLAEFRPLLEEHVHSLFNGKRKPGDMTGCCRGASGALLKVLRERFPEAEWKLAGGYGTELGMPIEEAEEWLVTGAWPGGFNKSDGVWCGHFWVVGLLPSGQSVIVDATADQFVHEPIIVSTADDTRYKANLRDKYDETAWIVAPETYFVDGLHSDWSLAFGDASLVSLKF